MFLILTSSESEVVNYKYFIFVTECVKIHLYYNNVTNLVKYNPGHALHDKTIAMTLLSNIGIRLLSFEGLYTRTVEFPRDQ